MCNPSETAFDGVECIESHVQRWIHLWRKGSLAYLASYVSDVFEVVGVSICLCQTLHAKQDTMAELLGLNCSLGPWF